MSKRNVVIIITLLSIVSMTFVTNWTLEAIKKQFQYSLISQLQAVLKTTNEAIKNWEELNKWALRHHIHVIEVERLAHKLIMADIETNDALAKHPLQLTIRQALAPAIQESGYQGFFIISPDFINLASTRDSNLGQKNLLSEKLLSRVLNGETLLSLPTKSDVPLPDAEGNLQDDQPTMFVLGPIRERHQADSPVVAILAFRIAPAQDFARIAQLGRFMKSGETYLFNNQGQMLNESRFIKDLYRRGILTQGSSSILNLEIREPKSLPSQENRAPYTKMAQSALAGHTDFDINGYNDYRGITVIGAWQWNPESNIGSATEINIAEAFQAYYTIRLLIVGALIVMMLFAAFMIFLFKNIQALKTAKKLAKMMTKEASQANKTLQNELKLSEAIANLLQLTNYASSEREVLKAALRVIPSLQFLGGQNIGAGFLVDPTTQELTLEAEHNLPKQLLTACNHIKYGQCLCGKSAESGEMIFTSAPDERHDIQFNGMIPYGKYCAPFLVDGKVEGVLAIYIAEGSEFHSDCAGFLYAIADIVAGAIKRIRAEKTTLKNERFASLGSMVAGVAHEINSPVGTAVTNLSELIEKTNNFQRKLKDFGIRKSDLDNYLQDSKDFSKMAQDNLFRAADLVRSFKLVAVDQSNEEEKHFNLLEHINAVITTLHHEFKRTKITIQVDCPPELVITTLPGPISQIITNLTHNSRIHGFDDGKKAGKIKISAAEKSNQLTLIYTDNGCGLNEEQRTKIFDPFYTTRRNQGGSGLGMNIVHNLITQRLNGTIELTTTIGQGVTFKITLPLKEIEPIELKDQSTPSRKSTND
jgi:signal transduction histidine kinase